MLKDFFYSENIQDKATNRYGTLVAHYDQAGLTKVEENAFKGQTLKSSYYLRKNYKQEVDWQSVESIVTVHTDLEREIFSSTVKYNAIGEIIEKIDSQNNVHIPVYDIAGRVKQIKLKKQGENIKTYVSDISYNPKGQRTSITYGNGVITNYSYDPETFRLTKLESNKGQKKLQSIHYTYDPASNITTMDDESYKTIFPNNKNIDTKSDYHYDSLYRLIEATGKEHPALSGKEEVITPIPHLNNQNAISNYTEYYDFDYGSNITRIRHNGKNSSTKEFYISSKSNRSLPIIDKRPVNENDIDASYDERGNLLKLSGTQNLHWNYRDNIAYVDIITRLSGKNDSEYYVYDSSGQRVRKVTETYQNNEKIFTQVEKIYFGDIEVTRTYQESGLKKEKYTVHIMDDKSRVALHHYWTKGSPDEIRENQDRYQLSNHLDSVALELNDNAEIITYEEYLPFGGTALIAGKTAREVTEKEYRYSGKERDESTGLYYYGARYYAPWLLRWINPDPAGTIDGLNLYLFVGGSPAIYRDKGGNAINDAIDYTEFRNTFQEGDKIYGLHSSREPYITVAESLYPKANTTIDDLNNQFIGTGIFNSSSEVYYEERLTPRKEEARKFKEFIENHPRYDPRKVPGVVKNPDLFSDQEWKRTNKEAYIRVGRASKAGIEFTTGGNKKIHFVLDGLDLGATAQKISYFEIKSIDLDADIMHFQREKRVTNKLKDVTQQELRYLYRNKDNKEMMQNVIFWKEGRKVDPPWKDFGIGKVYEKTRESGDLFMKTGALPIKWLWGKYLPKIQTKIRHIFGNSIDTKFLMGLSHLHPIYHGIAKSRAWMSYNNSH
ncbi:RHS repeat-associated core domain-containing protein [Wolbachia endosymbiont of Cylisticus convexus]|uniref:RHS repeat-associated core domain-containing protein n=1 Tax=Wolbachia endosymbiont of Cylisticus convexus TaxID=118728 RepID=UPI0015D00562|nr:RHS repeat-associated core domain-containing protein [Wolbachia endosymbiont of Cylisticus convexus]